MQLAKHPGGRPTKYSDNTIKEIEVYLSMCGREQTSLPTIEGLALHLGVTSETIRQWSKEKPEFSLTLKKLVDKQKQQLIDDGMYGGKEVNQAMAIFLLKANHNMSDGSNASIQAENITINVTTYGHNDPLRLQADRTKSASDPRFRQPSQIPSAELAQEGEKDNTGSQ